MAGISLSSIDLTIIALYFLVVLVIGLWLARRTKSGEDLFLAGRRLSWPAIGFSLFASNISSTTLIGLAGAAYFYGVAVSHYEWGSALILAFFAVFFVPAYIRARIGTVPEFLEKRFDRRSRLYFSGLTIFANIIVDTAGSLYAGAMVIKLFFPEVDLLTSCLLLAVVAGLYTAAGGLAAVVYTDIIQAIILLFGSCALTIITFGELDYSWTRIVNETPPQMLSVFLPADDPNLPWIGALVGVPVLGFYFWCTNQFIVQRVLGARDVRHARWGALLGGFLKLPVLFIMVLPGIMARILFPGLEKGDMIFPTMVTELLPVGVLGLVLAGLVAAIMSSIDSTLNSASALVVLDFISPRRPNLTPKQIALYGRVAIVVFMALAALFAPLISSYQGLFAYLQSALSYLVPPVVAIFIIGMFWPRANASGAFWTLAGGHAVSLTLFVLNKMNVVTLHFTIIAGLLFAISCLILIATSLCTTPPNTAAIRSLIYQRAAMGEGVTEGPRWYADYRVYAALLVVMTVAIVIAFW